jgi:soluble P-type ATPase
MEVSFSRALAVRDGLLWSAMQKPGIAIDIPGFGKRQIRTIISDYTGTLSRRGKLSPGVKSRLLRLQKLVDVKIVTADTYGMAAHQLKRIAAPHFLKRASGQDKEKRDFAKQFDLLHVAAFGNGNNDRLLLRAVKSAGGLAIAVDNGEGVALDALLAVHIFISGAANALDLLLNPNALKATLRF